MGLLCAPKGGGAGLAGILQAMCVSLVLAVIMTEWPFMFLLHAGASGERWLRQKNIIAPGDGPDAEVACPGNWAHYRIRSVCNGLSAGV